MNPKESTGSWTINDHEVYNQTENIWVRDMRKNDQHTITITGWGEGNLMAYSIS